MRYLVTIHLKGREARHSGDPIVLEFDEAVDFGNGQENETFFCAVNGEWDGLGMDCLGNYSMPISVSVKPLDGDDRNVRTFKVRETWIGVEREGETT